MDTAEVHPQDTCATHQVDEVAVMSYQSVNGQERALSQRGLRAQAAKLGQSLRHPLCCPDVQVTRRSFSIFCVLESVPMVLCQCISGHSPETVIFMPELHPDKRHRQDGGGQPSLAVCHRSSSHVMPEPMWIHVKPNNLAFSWASFGIAFLRDGCINGRLRSTYLMHQGLMLQQQCLEKGFSQTVGLCPREV